MTRLTRLTHRGGPWQGLRVLVTGLGRSGFAAADAASELGCRVVAVDSGESDQLQESRRLLQILDVDVRLGPTAAAELSDAACSADPRTAAAFWSEVDVVITSPGWPPTAPLLAAAAQHGTPVWSEVELAWRMRPEHGAAPWLTVTGTNGKTTTVGMLEAILRAAGLRARACGNIGTPVVEVMLDTQPLDVLVVELSTFQLVRSPSLRPRASACLNVGVDHLDWHGSLEAYVQAKGMVYQNTEVACVYNVQDPTTERLVMEADVVEGCRAIGFTLGTPEPSMVGLVDDVLADRAFVEERRTSAAELATLADLQGESPTVAPHYVADALAAAALARAHGVPPVAVRDGLRAYRPAAHRIAEVATVDGVRYVDDSKATNPQAAAAAIAAFEHVVWVAGGQLKGATVDDLVRGAVERLRGVVLLGQDRAVIADALARHAPEVPVAEVDSTDTGAMDVVVEQARRLAQPGDVVLLAPAGASWDMFSDYGARGDAFALAVRRRASGEAGS
jgi:UDP-N-acetylmuramoylalanine--D-glutamate ligase